jgi:hypothetical protein
VITVNLNDYERDLEIRKAALGFSGQDYVCQNSGTVRTEAKRELLRKLDEMARAKSETARFLANF